jgi:TRAP-type mannitol/chloroaromatic compound transport system permease large subunit
MLIIMADLMGISVGNLFSAAIVPGLSLATLYLTFIFFAAKLNPSVAPPLPPDLLTVPKGEMGRLLWRAFFPPVFLIGVIKLSILLGWATPSEAGAVGAAGAIVLAMLWGRMSFRYARARHAPSPWCSSSSSARRVSPMCTARSAAMTSSST